MGSCEGNCSKCETDGFIRDGHDCVKCEQVFCEDCYCDNFSINDTFCDDCHHEEIKENKNVYL